jgi:hypothetical protein
VRGFLIGLIFLVGLSVSVLSLRPGGLRRQLRFVARRFRITLVLGGIFIIGSLIIRLAFPDGVVADYGPPALAIVLAVTFIVFGRDPVPETAPPDRLP